MGLDIHLYHIEPPDLAENDRLSYQDFLKISSTVSFIPPEQACDAIKNNAVSVYVEEHFYDLEQMLSDVLEHCGLNDRMRNDILKTFTRSGSSHSRDFSSWTYETTDITAVRWLEDMPEHEFELEKLPAKQKLTCCIKENTITITLFSGNAKGYYGKYLRKRLTQQYACVMKEAAYQRGIDDGGWDMLPDNCQYCDNRERIKEMVDAKYLYPDFLKNWTDNSVLWAWW